MTEVIDEYQYNSKLQYLLHFITRSFLISIIVFMIFITFILVVYLLDLFINVSNSGYKAPLFSTYTIVSPSMVPTININDAIVVKRIDNDKYRIGDIITFSSQDINYEGLTVTHRIVNKQFFTEEESIYTTKGDGNEIVDPSKVTTKSIYGRVLFKIPKIGCIQEVLSNWILFIFVGGFFIFFMFYEFHRYKLKNSN